MLTRRTADEPERVLKPLSERRQALPTFDQTGIFPLRVGKHEVIEPMRENLPRKRHAKLAGIVEIRQALSRLQ